MQARIKSMRISVSCRKHGFFNVSGRVMVAYVSLANKIWSKYSVFLIEVMHICMDIPSGMKQRGPAALMTLCLVTC